MYGFDQNRSEEEIYEEELEEAEQMIRNGAGMRQIMRRQFTSLGQSDIYKLYRKYGIDPEDESEAGMPGAGWNGSRPPGFY